MSETKNRLEHWELIDIPWEARIAVAIFKRAADDWREQIRKKVYLCYPSNPDYDGFEELRCFFRSDWCKELAPDGMPAERMLEILEQELWEAKRAEAKK